MRNLTTSEKRIEKFLAKGGEITQVPAQKTPKQFNFGKTRTVSLQGQGSAVLGGKTGAAFYKQLAKKINQQRRAK